ncbi:RHS repeat-associated core domain-containing protein [Streptomyces sp. NR30]|uniref:RHS repeat-associated core domain-containing protein n=2 Tax=Streptomyces guryensis TaxID=2886947 RepID=A0A9Q3VN64_9ACTN|nr:RHS repeat-associated core domain-containing protein [Streptomyces guryensis]
MNVTDAAGNTTKTTYTPTDSGPLTKTKVTNALLQNAYTYTDYASGLPTKVYDVNNKITETTYDALGRKTATWLSNRSHAGGQTANYTYAYSVTNDAPSWTSTATLKADGTTYNTSYSIYDSLLRPLQTQSPTPDGGRLLTDTRYDSRGLAYETYADVFDSAHLPGGTYARAEYGGAPKQADTVYDGAGRPTSSTLYVYGAKKWTTSTSYTGDSTATTAPNGGSATRTITDIFGNIVEKRTYSGTDPADAAYGAGTGAAYTTTKYTNSLDGKPLTLTGPDGAQWSYKYDLLGRQISATDPDLGTTTTTYTNLDQTDTTTDNRGSQLLYGYDVLGRRTDQWQTSKTDANKLAHWDYDTLAKGQLDDSISYVGGTTGSAYTRKVTAYDNLYHATGTQLTLPSSDPLVTSGAVTSTLAFTSYYNIDGSQQYYKEPAAGGLSSETVDYEYNGLGQVTDVGGATGYLLAADYNALGQVNQYTLGTSTASTAKKAYITNTYEEGTDRLTRSLTTDATRSVQDLNFTHDDAGNVTSTFDTANLSGTGATDYQCFGYDGYQRLTDAWTPSTASCAASGRNATNLGGASPYWTSYSYTSSGLRTTETAHTGSGDTTKTYCYNTTAKPHRLTATTTATSCTGVGATYGYDDIGDTTTRPNGTDTQSLTWNATGHLDTVTEKSSSGTTKSTTSHVYDADGNLLVRRNTSGETVLYLGTTEVHLDAASSTAKYWAQRYYSTGSATIALRTNKSGTQTLCYLSGDPHGTPTVSLDSTTQAVTKRYLTPFGAARTGGTGVWADDKTFLGKTTDPTTSLTYIGAREYDSSIGRFLSVDPVLDMGDAQSLNGYAYGDNNPVTLSDPTGLKLDNCAHYLNCTANGGTIDEVPHSGGSGTQSGTAHGGGVGGTGNSAASSPTVNDLPYVGPTGQPIQVQNNAPFLQAYRQYFDDGIQSEDIHDGEARWLVQVSAMLNACVKVNCKQVGKYLSLYHQANSAAGMYRGTDGGGGIGDAGALAASAMGMRGISGRFGSSRSSPPTGKAPRTADGKFAKRNGEPGTDGSLDERTVMDQLELDGAPIVRGQVYARVPGFPLRKYDGAVQIDGHWLGVEVKGGSSPLTPPQREFDNWLNTPGNTVTTSGGLTLEGTFNAWVPH